MLPSVKIKVVDGGIVTVEGHLVTDTVSGIDTANIAQQVVCSESFLDLAKVDKMDTAGLAWVVFVIGKVKCSGKSISIVKPPSQLLKLAEISELTSSLPFTTEEG